MPPKRQRSRSKSTSPKKPAPPKGKGSPKKDYDMDGLTQALQAFLVDTAVTGAKKTRKSSRPTRAPVRLKAAGGRAAKPKAKAGKSQLVKCQEELAKHKETIKGMKDFLKTNKMLEEYTRSKAALQKKPFTDYGEKTDAAVFPRRKQLGIWSDGKVRFGKTIYY